MTTLTQINTEKLLATFLAMVRIDSPSGEEDAMRDWLVQWAEGLGLAHRTVTGGSLVVDIPGHGCSHESVLVLSGHLDVVPPCRGVQPVVKGEGDARVIHSDGTTVLGADDKAGLAVIVEVVEQLVKEKQPRPPLRLLLTTREEVSLGGAKDLPDDALAGAHFAVTFDHTGEQGTIIHAAPSYIQFTVECLGKSVHAGICPEQGVNAIQYASRVIDRLHLGRIDAETTCNIGFLTGGKATNVVPDCASFTGELRSHHLQTLERELAYIQNVLAEEKAKLPGADFTFQHQENFHVYRLDPDHPGLQHVVAAAQAAGLTPRLTATNGGSDNNVFVLRGLPGVVLSAGYVAPHALTEHVALRDIVTSSRFLQRIIERFTVHAF